MKLESLKSEKFRKLENNELNKINGGNADLSQEMGTGVTVTWTVADRKTDNVCSDC